MLDLRKKNRTLTNAALASYRRFRLVRQLGVRPCLFFSPSGGITSAGNIAGQRL